MFSILATNMELGGTALASMRRANNMPEKSLSSFGASSTSQDMPNARFLIDLTTSRQYQGHNPVGIVRVEREIGKAFLRSGYDVGFFHYEQNSGTMIAISRQQATAILGEIQVFNFDSSQLKSSTDVMQSSPEMADDDGFKAFLRYVKDRLMQNRTFQRSNVKQSFVINDTIEIFDGDVVISAGLVWDANFFEVLYRLKQKTNVFVAQIVYDTVPIVMPEFCVPGMNVRFPKFLLETAWTADAIYCISNNTLKDVKSYLNTHNMPLPALHRIRLGTTSIQHYAANLEQRSTLKPNNFIVYVSTIEPRKNHILLFHVWRQLYQTDRDVLIPLVIVGRHGWNSGDLVTMIKASESLYPDYIKLLMEVSDAELEWLYRNARFTVYPSLYEGWGLPVAESLAWGKFCIAANTSSIPEVAGSFADLIDPLDLQAWTRSIRHFLVNPHDVLTREVDIRERYQELSWIDAMQEFVASLTKAVEHSRAILTHESEH